VLDIEIEDKYANLKRELDVEDYKITGRPTIFDT
jgi:hypothetical protein